MANERNMDNIERDVIAAMRLGYGVHYGHYKADPPHTRDEELDVIKPIHKEVSTVCSVCGREFLAYHGNQKACSDECRSEAIRNAARERYRKLVDFYTPKKCLICGAEYMRKIGGRQKYCSLGCCQKAYRLAQQQRREAEKNAKAMGE